MALNKKDVILTDHKEVEKLRSQVRKIYACLEKTVTAYEKVLAHPLLAGGDESAPKKKVKRKKKETSEAVATLAKPRKVAADAYDPPVTTPEVDDGAKPSPWDPEPLDASASVKKPKSMRIKKTNGRDKTFVDSTSGNELSIP